MHAGSACGEGLQGEGGECSSRRVPNRTRGKDVRGVCCGGPSRRPHGVASSNLFYFSFFLTNLKGEHKNENPKINIGFDLRTSTII